VTSSDIEQPHMTYLALLGRPCETFTKARLAALDLGQSRLNLQLDEDQGLT
jgi:hypothetical protein